MMETGTVLRRFILIMVVALIGLNLRPFITSIGPLAGNIHDRAGLGLQGMALLTLVPMLLMGILAFAGPALLVLPAFARQSVDRRPWLWLTLIMQIAGFAGLMFAPGLAPYALAATLGAGLGGCFALSLIVALDHLPDPSQAGALTALMQGGGFIIAALPAWLVAALHDLTGGYAAGWFWHLISVAVVAGLVMLFAPKGYAKAMPPLDGEPRNQPLGGIGLPIRL